MADLSFAQTYILSNKVRHKLTKDAANPNASLRNLVVQANMLDNLMDYIADENKKRSDKRQEERKNRVSFELPERGRSAQHTNNTMITEYEVDSDSDSDYDTFSASDSDSDSDDYYYSDEEDEIETPLKTATTMEIGSAYKQLPSMDLSEFRELEAIEEENDEEDSEGSDELEETISEMPGLTHSISLTDDEDFDSNYIHSSKHQSHTVLHIEAKKKPIPVLNTQSNYIELVSLHDKHNHEEFALSSLF